MIVSGKLLYNHNLQFINFAVNNEVQLNTESDNFLPMNEVVLWKKENFQSVFINHLWRQKSIKINEK